MSGLYIRKFVDRLQQCELKGQKDYSCPIADAKNLHNDITKLLLDLESLREANQQQEQVIQMELGGGDF
jgi:hypothetical protein